MMRNIERFPSKQMYPYLSLVERKVAEFYHNIDRRRWLVWVKMTYFHHSFRTIHGVLAMIGLGSDKNKLAVDNFSDNIAHLYWGDIFLFCSDWNVNFIFHLCHAILLQNDFVVILLELIKVSPPKSTKNLPDKSISRQY